MSGLTRVEREALWSAWLAGDVSKGLGWLAPAVEKIIAAREQAARKDQAKIIAEAIEKMTLRGRTTA
ncbi:hypothetical protein [Nocardioides alcanivorans]|uniref:hypothetical protein n=1 Tax=Nocardioides alcanivorans TaxID=2897352 RepID=UPI001F467A8A|nr:hypothetical protein [Nocardioides alcanivorans]